LQKFLKTIIGILLLPLVVSVSLAFYRQFGNIEVTFTKDQRYFLWGIIAYCFIQLFLFKPVYVYVLGHEAVHALATWICFGKVKSFKISSKGGSVSSSKTNLFISLSPYFIPFYGISLILGYYLINSFFSKEILTRQYFMFLLGMTLAFHIAMTIDTLKTKQPDLVKVGYLTSSIIIYIINLLIIAGTLELLVKDFSFRSFLNNAYLLTINTYKSIFHQLFL